MTDQAQELVGVPTSYRCWLGRYRLDAAIQYTQVGDVLIHRVEVHREKPFGGSIFIFAVGPEEIVPLADLNSELRHWTKAAIAKDRATKWWNKGTGR